MCDRVRGASPASKASLSQAPSTSPIPRRSTTDKTAQATLSRNRLDDGSAVEKLENTERPTRGGSGPPPAGAHRKGVSRLRSKSESLTQSARQLNTEHCSPEAKAGPTEGPRGAGPGRSSPARSEVTRRPSCPRTRAGGSTLLPQIRGHSLRIV